MRASGSLNVSAGVKRAGGTLKKQHTNVRIKSIRSQDYGCIRTTVATAAKFI